MRRNRIGIFALAAAGAAAAYGQTQAHLATQGRHVDFTQALFTRPVKTGTTLPAVCTVGELFFKSDAAPGSNLFGCTATNLFTQLGSGTGGAVHSRQLTDLNAVRSGGDFKVLLLAQDCSALSPCLAGFGGRTVSLLQGATATLGGTANGTGTAYVYVTPGGLLTVGYTIPAGNTLTCSSGCTAVAGVAAFPENAIPLFTWTATWSGGAPVWDATGGADRRAFLSTKTVSAGTGVQVTDTLGEAVVAVNTAVVGLRVAAPATASSACTAGSWAADGAFFYVCHAANTWVRAALATF